MSKFLKSALGTLAALLALAGTAQAGGDAAAGKAKFQQCAGCHRIGEGAKNALGPALNDLIGRAVGSVEGFKYSPAMKKKGEEGLVWDEKTLDEFLAGPMKYVKGTRMAFPGLKAQTDRQNVIEYLKTNSKGAGDKADASDAKERPAGPANDAAETATKADTPDTATAEAKAAGKQAAAAGTPVSHEVPDHGVYHLGRKALPAEIEAWDVDIRPDGTGLPKGHGTVAEGEQLFSDNCASCHGDFGEGVGRWPVLAGGQDSLSDQRPVKTVGSYWPYLSTVYDYIRRAMPFGNAHSLSNDDVYALTAYILSLNYVVDEDFELSDKNFGSVKMPNADGFVGDDRMSEPEYAKATREPCMKDCKDEPVKITMRAQVLDVTPDGEGKGDEEKGKDAGIQ